MKLAQRLLCFVFAAILGLCITTAKAEPTKPIIAAGSGVNLAITKILGDAFMVSHPDIKVQVPGSIGTKGAIAAVKENAITFGLISRPLKNSEQSPEMTMRAYALTPLVIGANESVQDNDITSSELVAIYKGEQKKWKSGEEIIVQIREAFDSGFMILENSIPGFAQACEESRKTERWTTYFTDQDTNMALANTKNAIGVTDLGMIMSEKLSIKPLKLDGVLPTIETVQNGAYPLKRTLFFLFNEKALSPEAKAFLDFVASDKGAEILRAHGYVPLMEK